MDRGRGARATLTQQERCLTFSQRFEEIRTGFERPFWVANISELFERLSYYAAFASLARYLHETLNFGVERASSLTGLFGGLVWFLAAFGGTLADRLGFRRSLSLAYLILSCSYFLIGSIGSPWFAPVRGAVPLVGLFSLPMYICTWASRTFSAWLPSAYLRCSSRCCCFSKSRAVQASPQSVLAKPQRTSGPSFPTRVSCCFFLFFL